MVGIVPRGEKFFHLVSEWEGNCAFECVVTRDIKLSLVVSVSVMRGSMIYLRLIKTRGRYCWGPNCRVPSAERAAGD